MFIYYIRASKLLFAHLKLCFHIGQYPRASQYPFELGPVLLAHDAVQDRVHCTAKIIKKPGYWK